MPARAEASAAARCRGLQSPAEPPQRTRQTKRATCAAGVWGRVEHPIEPAFQHMPTPSARSPPERAASVRQVRAAVGNVTPPAISTSSEVWGTRARLRRGACLCHRSARLSPAEAASDPARALDAVSSRTLSYRAVYGLHHFVATLQFSHRNVQIASFKLGGVRGSCQT